MIKASFLSHQNISTLQPNMAKDETSRPASGSWPVLQKESVVQSHAHAENMSLDPALASDSILSDDHVPRSAPGCLM